MNATLTPPKAESITLYYREGSSDKVYQCSIEPEDGLFVVNFAYGRRGTTLQTGRKTSLPVLYQDARVVFDQVVQEKTAKGYTPGEDGTPYVQTESEDRITAIRPQLLNAIDEAEARRLLNDRAWGMQEKKDGRRLLLQKQGAAIHGINKRGLMVGLPSCLVPVAQRFSGDLILDGECVGEVFHAFDLLELDGVSLMSSAYRQRLSLLIDLLEDHSSACLKIVPTATAPAQKAIRFKRLQAEKKEGVVFKRLDAPYVPGRPNSGGTQLKYKFIATLSAVVTKINPQRSVEVRLLKGDGWVTAGNVTIPANHPVPKVGAVAEVRYLYAIPASGCLFQPVFLGVRHDVESHECVVSQLKFKADDDLETA